VIPFSSQIPDNNICADEITDSIIMGLAKFREMRIIGPLVRYQNRFVDVEEIGRRYYVRFVLQGRVQIQGDKLRVTVGLTDSHTGYNIWSQTYEYLQAATNLLDAEDNVSRRIINALADYMGIIPSLIIRESKKKDPEGLEIHEAILSQKHYLKVFETQSYLAAVEALEHAVKVDPDHPIALATLGNAYCHNHLFDMGLLSATLEDAERLVQRAIAFDSECQMAHFTEGVMRYLQGQTDQCIEKLHLTISLNNLDAYFMYGSAVMTCMVGYWKEGAALFEQARKLNSQHPPFYFVLPFMDHYRKGEYQEAWNYALRFNTSIYVDPLIRAAAAGQLGLKDQAEIALQELLDMKPDFPSHPQDLLRRCFFLDEHVEMLLEGLLKAGLKLEVSKN
jgi:TolB-like protein